MLHLGKYDVFYQRLDYVSSLRKLSRIINVDNEMCQFYHQNVESVFDIMDLEDEERNKLLKLDDSQMQVKLCIK
jgi:hypothetical protein